MFIQLLTATLKVTTYAKSIKLYYNKNVNTNL